MSDEPAAAVAPAAPEVVPAAEAVPAEPAAAVEEPTKEAKPVAVVDGPDPSSPLVDKLSTQDKTAIKALRAKLPEILKSAYEDTSKPERTTTTIWGVTLDPASPPSAKEFIVYYKFLKARNMSVDAARDMLLATLRWRDEMDIDAIMKEEFPEDVFGTLGRISGKDKEGRPVTYNLYGEVKDNKAVFGDVKRFIRWRVQLMEKGVALLDFETVDQMVQVHDYTGVSSSSRTPESKAAASEASSVFGSHYPELLSRKFFVGVPTLMSWIFWVFKAIVPSQTFAKMTVVGTGSATIGKELEKVIEKKELPERYGGEGSKF
ncbi:CRAL/TRIO domain-containing protein [Exidia glandulosa HHB12029]|uniref:Phosphatidylinositol transfer protein SFH5 n=1 Tax=Exidia glandulosa HHB12029 TaxID=1314781 RepID=A0A165H639_EXIGL|nr:CRAL/TRIO domain-containing protein [Exidia glandulosa HHB12029]